MSEQVLSTLLPALTMAAFERRADGAFASVAPPPPWFTRIASDPTFPFLGHILEEANHFWQRGTSGTSEWGPCAEVDETGKEFHYKVTAVTAESGDPGYRCGVGRRASLQAPRRKIRGPDRRRRWLA